MSKSTASTGDIEAYEDGKRMDPNTFRAASPAQTAKQIMIQKIREAEPRTSFFNRLRSQDRHARQTARCSASTRGAIIVNLGPHRRPRAAPGNRSTANSTDPGEPHPGAYVVRRAEKKRPEGSDHAPPRARIPISSRNSSPSKVPEIGDRIVEIKGIVREPGHRTKIAGVFFRT